MNRPVKLEYELSGPSDEEETRLFYNDIVEIYKLLIGEGFAINEIEMTFKTESYSCEIRDADFSLEGKLNKKIKFVERNPPMLEDFLQDVVKEAYLTLEKGSLPYAQISIKQDDFPSRYKLEAHLNSIEQTKLLQKIDDKIEGRLIRNSERIRHWLAPFLKTPTT